MAAVCTRKEKTPIFKPLDKEYFGTTFSSSDEGFLVLMSESQGLSHKPNVLAASDKLSYFLGSNPSN